MITMVDSRRVLRARQRLGKYRIERRLAEGPFAVVYEAYDTVEGTHVALKVPHPHLTTRHWSDWFRKEARMAARLDHVNILPLKNAEFIDGYFVIASPLGECSLADRLCHRLSTARAMELAEQLLEAVAYAHQHRIIHCDIKPDNVILFPGNRLRLADFGIARVALRTVKASGSGTVGYVAPEQAMGRPSFQSDVFSLGLILYRMFAGTLPEWPYRWPPPGYDRLRRRLHPDMIAVIRKALQFEAKARYENAQQMLAAFRRARARTERWLARRRRRAASRE